jgi:hypothetical protein
VDRYCHRRGHSFSQKAYGSRAQNNNAATLHNTDTQQHGNRTTKERSRPYCISSYSALRRVAYRPSPCNCVLRRTTNRDQGWFHVPRRCFWSSNDLPVMERTQQTDLRDEQKAHFNEDSPVFLAWTTNRTFKRASLL